MRTYLMAFVLVLVLVSQGFCEYIWPKISFMAEDERYISLINDSSDEYGFYTVYVDYFEKKEVKLPLKGFYASLEENAKDCHYVFLKDSKCDYSEERMEEIDSKFEKVVGFITGETKMRIKYSLYKNKHVQSHMVLEGVPGFFSLSAYRVRRDLEKRFDFNKNNHLDYSEKLEAYDLLELIPQTKRYLIYGFGVDLKKAQSLANQ